MRQKIVTGKPFSKCKKMLVYAFTGALVFSTLGTSSKAASKPVLKLNKKKITLDTGEKQTLKITKKNIKKIKKTTWSSSKKKVVTVTKKGTITAKKAGTSIIKAKVCYLARKQKKYQTKTLKCSVTVKNTNTSTPGTPTTKPTRPPEGTPWPTATPAPKPQTYGKDGEVSAYDNEKTNYTLDIDAANKVHGISDMLYGIFIEDINFAADGGLYAEMVQNRSFEFTKLAMNNEKHGWNDVGNVSTVVENRQGLNVNNPNYIVITNNSGNPAGIANTGFLDGMSVIKDATYDFSVYAKGFDGYTGPIRVDIMNGTTSIATGIIPTVSADWKKYELSLTCSETVYSTANNLKVSLQLTIDKGKLAADMISLFPRDTFKGRKNGMRKDLAQKLEELHPAFLRFPGGCVIEGSTLENRYNWKDSIGVGPDGEPLEFNGTYGDVATRKQGQNIWTNENITNDKYPCYMSYGLGFYEYFQLAEDIGAIGVPVLNCGACCMIRNPNGPCPAIDSAEFQQYIQDALDLVEFCRGDASTKWGRVRISMGHEKPFALKYIGIGNEQWGSKFYQRYEKFVEAFDEAKKKNPDMYGDIELMYSAGVDDGDSDRVNYPAAYREAADWLKRNPGKSILDFTGAIDHHYYNSPDWFLTHTDYYDPQNYSRDTDHMTSSTYGGGMQVFLGEYAAQSNTWRAALSEAAYMTGLERNGDIVRMAAYAPLFGNLTGMHWAPDLIWFNNHTSTSSVNYYVQKAFAKNAGTELLSSKFASKNLAKNTLSGKVGVGTWNTAAKFDNVKVVDNATGKAFTSEDFSYDTLSSRWEAVSDGNWSVKNGELVQSNTRTNTNAYGNVGSTLYYGGETWENYTYTVDATKTAGEEGFLIPFAVGDKDNNYFWNIGGWNNTISCLQQVSNGTKSDQIAGTVKNIKITNGKKYSLKVVVSGDNVKCYIDNVLYVDYTISANANMESYQVVSTDKTGDIIIKMVNVSDSSKTFAIDITGAEIISETAALDVVAGTSLNNDNILGENEVVTMKSSEITGIGKQFNYTVPKYSVTVMRVKTR